MDSYHFIRIRTSGRTQLVYVVAISKEMALEKAILKFKHIKGQIEKMDLLTAKERAGKASADSKKPYFVILEEDGECGVNTAPLNGAIHKFVNGKEDRTFKPKMIENNPQVESDSEIPQELKLTKTTSKMEKEVKAKKAAKKVAAKKSAKKVTKKSTAAKVATIVGDKKTLTIEQIIKLQNGGKRIYRAVEPHYILINERMKAMADKTKKIDCIIRKD